MHKHSMFYNAILAALILSLATACVLPAATPIEEAQPTSPAAQPTSPAAPTQPQATEPSSLSEGGGVKVLESPVQRDTSPQVSPAELQALAAGNSAFALDFYQAVRGERGNLFFSPYSLSVALAMTYAGARDETERQMAETLHFRLPQERLHPAFNALDLSLSADAEAQGESQPFQLSVANSLWGQQGYKFLDPFLDTLALNYGAGLRLVDFARAAEAARQEINQWVDERTQGKIKDLIPEGGVNSATVLVLANAIYFKADWLFPFSAERTRDAPFTLLDGSQVDIPMMAFGQAQGLLYMRGAGFQAVELPYVAGASKEQISMLVLVPDAGEFEAFEAGLDDAQVQVVLAGLRERTVSLSMPKFSFTSEYDLAERLAGMGIPAAFDASMADFSGMDGTRTLFIGDVFHKAFVAVDEKGTEAAAATAVVIAKSALMMPDEEVIVERPFIFLIRDKTTGTILFVGRVLDPR